MTKDKRVLSDEHKKKLSESRKGIVFTAEHKENIRKAVLAKPLTVVPGHNKVEHKLVDGIECKYCPKCDTFLELEKFNKVSRNYDGLDNCCKVCYAAKRKKRYDTDEEYRQKQIDYGIQRQKDLKTKYVVYKGTSCVDCGLKHIENKNEALFDFHHTNSANKTFGIAERVGLSLEKMKLELDKCELLCANCHALRHQQEWKNYGDRNKKPPTE